MWQFSAARLVKVSNDQGVYLGLVLVATDSIIIIDRICWGIDKNPKLDIESNSNGAGIAPKIYHWYLVIFQKIDVKISPSGYNRGKDFPIEVEKYSVERIGAYYYLWFGVFALSRMYHIGLREYDHLRVLFLWVFPCEQLQQSHQSQWMG